MSKTHEEPALKGMAYGNEAVGKNTYRVSEQYVAEHVAPLVKAHRVDAAKLDLILRGIALSPEHAGKRRPGTVLRRRGRVDYAYLHDLVRDPRRFSISRPEDDDDDAAEREQKREWVREQLRVLERRQLLVRADTGEGPRQITMLCDLGTGDPFDDPGDKKNQRPYVTVFGGVVASSYFRDWGAPELAGYFCAMVADRYARNAMHRKGVNVEVGGATWYRQAEWFNNKNGYRPEGHVVLPFSTKTIERGLESMRKLGFVEGVRRRRSPDGDRFVHPRMIYTNRFSSAGATAEIIDMTSREKLA